jgi:hypothetical protein
LKAFTNARGEFAVRLPKEGAYLVSARLDGYFADRFGSSEGRVDADHPVMRVRLDMLRFAEMTGRVLDAETGEPVRGVAVVPVQRGFSVDGTSSWTSLYTAVTSNPAAQDALRAAVARLRTDANGIFRVRELRPGTYLAAVFDPQASDSKYSPQEAKVIDTEYERVFWPGGLPADAAVAQEVRSGGVFNVGDIRLKKVPFYRVHVRIPQGACPEGESVRVSVLQRNLAPRPAGVFPCGSDVLLRGFEPGSYTLYAVSDWQGERDNVEAAVWATAPFTIDKENGEVTLELRRGVVLKGRIVAGEGMKETPARLPLTSRPGDIVEGSRPPAEEFIEWGENGEFRMAVGGGRQTVVGPRMIKDAYIGKVYYNGSPARDLTIDAQPGEKQTLEVIVENKFASLEGSIEGPASGPQAMLALWQKEDTSPVYFPVNASGVFQLRVPPGEYRVALTLNGLTRDAMSGAQNVVLTAGETAKVTLKGMK